MGFDSIIIYKFHIKKQNKIIYIKNLHILEKIISKVIIFFLDFDKKSIFNIFQILKEKLLNFDKNINFESKKNISIRLYKNQTKIKVNNSKNANKKI